MADSASSLLSRLESLVRTFGGDAAAAKMALLQPLRRRPMRSAAQVARLHECLAFAQAYPDNAAVLDQVQRMLDSFAARADLRRFRSALADSGIAGTATHYPFFWPTARWLVRRWPDRLTIDWAEFADRDKLIDLLPVLLPYTESLALDALDLTARQWLHRLKGEGETDAAFLVRRFEALKVDPLVRQKIFEDLATPMRLAPGRASQAVPLPGARPVPGAWARTAAKLAGLPVVFQSRPLSRDRPDLKRVVRGAKLKVRLLSPRDGQRFVDAAVSAMISRGRDLDAFAYGDRRDVRLVDAGGGLVFVVIGQQPQRRLMLESVYGFVIVKNGVPIGYGLISSLFNSSEIAFNIFDTFRGAQAAAVFTLVAATARRLFGADAFSIDPYQLGHDNHEGLASGAWWFYAKLGFSVEDPALRRLARGEQRRAARNPRYRSSIATLQKLSAEPMYVYLGRPRRDVLAKLEIGDLGLRVSRLLAQRFGSDREKALRAMSRQAAQRLGVRAPSRWPAAERQAWRRWCPLVMALPGIERWNAADRRALVRIVRAKGGQRESDYVTLFDQHRPLRRAILQLARPAPD